MVTNGKIVVPKVLHNIVNLIGIMLGKIIHNNLNGLRISNLLGKINKKTSGLTNKIINGKIRRTNGNHPKPIASLKTNGEDLNNGLIKILVIPNYHL